MTTENKTQVPKFRKENNMGLQISDKASILGEPVERSWLTEWIQCQQDKPLCQSSSLLKPWSI